jgi:ribosomal-protein-alanine N-acetyltransferase
MDRLLLTERLKIKIVTPQQIREWFANESKEEVKKRLHLHTDEAFELARRKSDLGYSTFRTTMRFFYFYLKSSDRFIGDVAFHNWFPDHRRSEIGYMIHEREDREQGYMFEAVQRIMQYGFEEMELNRIEACIGPANAASLALIKKLGFTQEGYLRQHYNKEGELQDSVLFALLKQDWKK